MVSYYGLLGIFILLSHCANAARYTVANMPDDFANYGEDVQFFYLESSFPFNAPISIRDAAGSAFNTYVTTHSGIGAWNSVTEDKLSIELVSNDYVGSLLPDLDSATGEMTWNNTATVVVTWPMVENDWQRSQLVTATSGVAWAELSDWLQDNTGAFPIYQPVTVVKGVVVEELNKSVPTAELLDPQNSYAFTSTLIDQLGSYGCDMESFLPLYFSAFAYQANDTSTHDLTLVSYTDETPPPDVFDWFTALTACYEQYFNSLGQSGASAYLVDIKNCYGAYAYVYASDNSVYNITLERFNITDYDTPYQYRTPHELPPEISNQGYNMGVMDWIAVSLIILFMCSFAYYAYFHIVKSEKEEQVYFHGGVMAEKTVFGVLERKSDISTQLGIDKEPASATGVGVDIDQQQLALYASAMKKKNRTLKQRHLKSKVQGQSVDSSDGNYFISTASQFRQSFSSHSNKKKKERESVFERVFSFFGQESTAYNDEEYEGRSSYYSTTSDENSNAEKHPAAADYIKSPPSTNNISPLHDNL